MNVSMLVLSACSQCRAASASLASLDQLLEQVMAALRGTDTTVAGSAVALQESLLAGNDVLLVGLVQVSPSLQHSQAAAF